MALKAGRKGVFAFRQKTAAQTEQAGIDAQGRVWYEGGSYTLPVATASTLGGVKVAAATEAQTEDVGIDENGKLKTKPQGSYTLPVATPNALGGVKPVAKTSAMTANVGVDENGALFAAAGGGLKLVWSNPNPTSGGMFNPQTIQSSDIITGGIYLVLFSAGGTPPPPTTAYTGSVIVECGVLGGVGMMEGFYNYFSSATEQGYERHYRKVTFTEGSVAFGDGEKRSFKWGSSVTTYQYAAIPLKIYKLN